MMSAKLQNTITIISSFLTHRISLFKKRRIKFARLSYHKFDSPCRFIIGYRQSAMLFAFAMAIISNISIIPWSCSFWYTLSSSSFRKNCRNHNQSSQTQSTMSRPTLTNFSSTKTAAQPCSSSHGQSSSNITHTGTFCDSYRGFLVLLLAYTASSKA